MSDEKVNEKVTEGTEDIEPNDNDIRYFQMLCIRRILHLGDTVIDAVMQSIPPGYEWESTDPGTFSKNDLVANFLVDWLDAMPVPGTEQSNKAVDAEVSGQLHQFADQNPEHFDEKADNDGNE
jgi:hypothetical protein